MAEWLGNGLQNRAQQFDSAWNLHPATRRPIATGLFLYIISVQTCTSQKKLLTLHTVLWLILESCGKVMHPEAI